MTIEEIKAECDRLGDSPREFIHVPPSHCRALLIAIDALEREASETADRTANLIASEALRKIEETFSK